MMSQAEQTPWHASKSELQSDLDTNSADTPTDLVENQKSTAESPAEADIDDCPNGGYGWVCVLCCFLINAHSWGLNSAYGVILAYYLDNDVFDGGTSLRYAFVGGLSISMALLVAPVATLIVRHFGTRICCLVGVLFQTISFIGASFVKDIWQLFLTQGIAFGWGMGFLFVASVNVPPQWFTTRRSLANGISAGGSGFGGLIYSLAVNASIKSIGLPWTFRMLGIIVFVVNSTCALLLRDRNLQIGTTQVAFDYRLFRKLEFNMLLFWGFFSMLGYVVILFSLPNYASSIGLTARQGSIVGAILQLGQMLGRPPIGYFSDSFGRINMAATSTFLAGFFSLVIWTVAKSYGVLIFFAFIVGLVAGTFWGTVAPVTAEVGGLKNLPSALSLTWLFLVIPTTFSEPIALEIAEGTSTGYLGTQLFSGFMYMAAVASLWWVRAWKIGQLEAIEAAKQVGAEQKVSSFFVRMVAWKKV